MATGSKSIPFVVPSQSTPDAQPISQIEIALVLSLRDRLHLLSQQVETAEESLKRRLEQGASVEIGDRTATLQTNFRRNVRWKSVARRLAEHFRLNGEVFTARVLAETDPTPIVSLELK